MRLRERHTVRDGLRRVSPVGLRGEHHPEQEQGTRGETKRASAREAWGVSERRCADPVAVTVEAEI